MEKRSKKKKKKERERGLENKRYVTLTRRIGASFLLSSYSSPPYEEVSEAVVAGEREGKGEGEEVGEEMKNNSHDSKNKNENNKNNKNN